MYRSLYIDYYILLTYFRRALVDPILTVSSIHHDP